MFWPLVVFFTSVILFLLVMWEKTGGFWTPVRDRSSVTVKTANTQSQPGEAERISAFLFQGQYIPGFSKAPHVEPSATELALRESREATEKVRLSLQQQAAHELTKRLGVPLDDIALESWGERDWLDSELGCAAPTDVVAPLPKPLPGWIFVFRYADTPGVFHIYHSTRPTPNNTSHLRMRYCGTSFERID
jgi:hypothetical protein